jgi:hypothetical protein
LFFFLMRNEFVHNTRTKKKQISDRLKKRKTNAHMN